MSIRISRSEALITVPQKKVIKVMENTIKKCSVCSDNGSGLDNACQKCRYINLAYKRYAESNIPIRYWSLEMKRDFDGDKSLRNKYEEIVNNLDSVYDDGACVCFAGRHGVGKTFVCTNILKRAVEKGYNSLYVTLSDMVDTFLTIQGVDKYIARKELLTVDFLVIDEFDPRHMASDAASDLFGRTLENVFRTRTQNSLPIFMCTNSPNVLESFTGAIKQSISSLMNYVETVPVLGEDARERKR